MNNRQKRFFNIAREVSLLSDFKRARIGAVIVEKNRIISTGHNSSKTSTIQDRYNKYRDIDDFNICIPRVHAEIAAITPLLKQNIDWAHTSIYVYRELKNGHISCARPCKACAQLIRELGIKKIFYTDWDGSYICEENLNEN